MKSCIHCKLVFSANKTNFPPSKSSADGLVAYCRPCKRLMDKQYDRVKRKRLDKKGVVKNCENCQWRFENNCAVKIPGAVTCVELTDTCRKWESVKVGQVYDEMSSSLGDIYTDAIDFNDSVNGF